MSESEIRFWTESIDGLVLVNRWRCRRCGMEGAWVEDGRVGKGVPGGHLCPEEMKRRIEGIDILVTKLENALRQKVESEGREVKAENLPPGSVVANGDEVWIREGEDNVEIIFCRDGWMNRPWMGTFSQATSDEEIDEMLTSGKAKILRMGSEG